MSSDEEDNVTEKWNVESLGRSIVACEDYEELYHGDYRGDVEERRAIMSSEKELDCVVFTFQNP